MAKSVKSDKWFARIDGTKEFLTTKCKELVQQIDVKTLLAFYHIGEKKDNPHIHICIEMASSIQKQSFALRLKNMFGIEKKSQYALQPWDGHRTAGAVSYMFHEDTSELVWNKGFTEDELASARKSNDAVQRVIAINKEKSSHKLVEKAYEYCLKELKEYDGVKCLAYMLQEIKEGNNYHPGDFMLRKYCEEIEIRMCGNIEDMARDMYFRWYNRA